MFRSVVIVAAGICAASIIAEAKSRYVSSTYLSRSAIEIIITDDQRGSCNEQRGCLGTAALVPVSLEVVSPVETATLDTLPVSPPIVAPPTPRARTYRPDRGTGSPFALHVYGGFATVHSRQGTGRVDARYGQQFQAAIAEFEQMGYKIGTPGCLAPVGTHMHHSRHYTGDACDLFAQYARNRTRFRQPSPAVQIAVARRHGLISGCMWRNPDCGHIEAPAHGESVAQYAARRGYLGHGSRVAVIGRRHHYRHHRYYAEG